MEIRPPHIFLLFHRLLDGLCNYLVGMFLSVSIANYPHFRYIIIYYHGDFEEDHLPKNQERTGEILLHHSALILLLSRLDPVCLADQQLRISFPLQVRFLLSALCSALCLKTPAVLDFS